MMEKELGETKKVESDTEELPELEEGERHKGKDARKNIICCKIKGKKYKCC
jgi:hypothetical protein